MTDRSRWRRDWWRFWIGGRPGDAFHRRALSITIRTDSREVTVGYRRKDWIQ